MIIVQFYSLLRLSETQEHCSPGAGWTMGIAKGGLGAPLALKPHGPLAPCVARIFLKYY